MRKVKKEQMIADLKAYLDQELTSEQVTDLKKVLAEDPSLREEAESFSRISASLRAFQGGPAVPADGVERALGVAEASWRIHGRKRPWVLAVSGAFALVVFAGLLVLRQVGDGIQGEKVGGGGVPDERVSLSYNFSPPSESAVLGKKVAPKEDAPAREERFRSYVSQRYVIRRASVHLRVGSLSEAERRVRSLVSLWGGFVEGSTQESEEGQKAFVTMLLRVPESHFEEALTELDRLGVRTRRVTSGEDVTAEVVDYEARLRNLRAEEEAYRQIMRSARRVVDILEVQARLSRVRGEIESLEGQLQALKRLSALSTIELTLEERPKGGADGDPNWAVDAWRRATTALVVVLRSIAIAVIWAFVYSPVWLPIVFLGILGWRVARR